MVTYKYKNNGHCDYLVDENGEIAKVQPLPETVKMIRDDFNTYESVIFRHPYYLDNKGYLYLSISGISKMFDIDAEKAFDYITKRYTSNIVGDMIEIYNHMVILDVLARFNYLLFKKLDSHDKLLGYILGVITDEKEPETVAVNREEYTELLQRVERLEAEIGILSHLISDNK